MRQIVIGIVIQGKDEAGPALRKAGEGAKGFNNETERGGKKADEAEKKTGGFAKTLRTLNSAVMLAEKAWRLLNATVGAAIVKSIESRSAFDANGRALSDLQRSTGSLQRSVGDVLVPILASFGKAFQPLIDGVRGWMDANRELVASELAGWLAKIGKLLTGVIAFAVINTARAFAGLYEVFLALKLVGDRVFEGVLQGLSQFMAEAGPVVDILMPGMSAAFRDAQRAIDDNAAAFGRAGDAAQRSILETDAKLTALEGSVRKVEAALDQALDKGAGGASARAAQAISRLTGTTDFYTQSLIQSKLQSIEFSNSQEEIARTISGLAASITKTEEEARALEPSLHKAFGQMRADNMLSDFGKLERGIHHTFEKNAEDIKNFDQKLHTMSGLDVLLKTLKLVSKGTLTAKEGFGVLADYVKENADGIASTLSGNLMGAFEQIAEGTKTAAQAFADMGTAILKMIGETLLQMLISWGIEQGIMEAKKALGLTTEAELAAAKVAGAATGTAATTASATTEIAANSAVAQSGALAANAGIPFVGIALGIAAAAMIAGIIAGLVTSFADGGWVGGGTPGRDSVPALLMPGEYVETRAEARAMRGPGGLLTGGAPASPPARSSGGGGGGTTVYQMALPMSAAEIERFHRDTVLPAQSRVRRRV